MKKLYLFLLFSIFYVISGQQETLKVKELHQVNTYNGGKVITSVFDQSGNNISIGYSNGIFNFNNDIIETVGTEDLFIYKSKNENNEKVWMKTLSSGQKGIVNPLYAKSILNDVYVVVQFKGIISIKGVEYVSNDEVQFMLIKVSEDGDIAWGNIIPKPLRNEFLVDRSSENIYLTIDSNKILKVNDFTGLQISVQNFDDFTVYYFESFNNELYFQARSNKNIDISGTQITSGQSFIVKADESFNLNQILTFKQGGASFSGPSIQRFKIIDANNLVVVVQSNLRNTVVAEGANSFQVSGDVVTTASTANYYWIGNFNTSLDSNKWFFGNGGRIGENLNIGRGNSINIFTKNQNIYFKNQTFSFDIMGGFLSIDLDGEFINTSKIQTFNGSSYNSDYSYDQMSDYYIAVIAYFKSVVFKKEKDETEFKEQYSYSILNSKAGSIGNGGFLKVNENKDFYVATTLSNYIPNYFGKEIKDNNKGSNYLSKISKTGSVLWNISVTGGNFNSNDIQNTQMTTISDDENTLLKSDCGLGDFGNCELKVNDNIVSTFSGKSMISRIDKDGNLKWNNFVYSKEILQNGNINTSAVKFSAYESKDAIFLFGRALYDLYYNDQKLMAQNPNWSMYTFIIKLDKEGNFIYAKKFENTLYSKGLIKFDENDNPILFGNYVTRFPSDVLTFDNLSFNAVAVSDFIMVKLDKNTGEAVSGKNLTPLGESNYYLSQFRLVNVIADKDSFLILGNTDSNVGLDGQVFNNPYYGYQTSEDRVSTNTLSKIDKNGNVLWTLPFFSKHAPFNNYVSTGIAVDDKSNIYVHTGFQENLTLKDVEYSFNNLARQQSIIKLDQNGNLKYLKKLDNYLLYQSFNIDVKEEDNVFLSGNTTSDEIDGNTIDNHNGYNYYIAVLEKDYLQTLETKKESLVLYPNPSSDLVFIKDHKNYNQAKLYDATGKMVLESKSLDKGISISQLPNGIYYIELLGKERAVSKIIKK